MRKRSTLAIEQALARLSEFRYRVDCKNESGEQAVLWFESRPEDSTEFVISLCETLRHDTSDETFFVCSVEEMA